MDFRQIWRAELTREPNQLLQILGQSVPHMYTGSSILNAWLHPFQRRRGGAKILITDHVIFLLTLLRIKIWIGVILILRPLRG